MEFEITDRISKADSDAIFEGLMQYNLAHIEDKNHQELGVYLRDAEGNIVAGLTADTHGLWLSVKYLWVSENLRGQDIGSRILSQAEETAKKRGCMYAFLDTFDFQALDFYKKYGYNEVFTLENYPITGKRHYLTKAL